MYNSTLWYTTSNKCQITYSEIIVRPTLTRTNKASHLNVTSDHVR